MIASLRGRLLEVLADGAVIEVGGVGYRVFLTPKAAAEAAPRAPPAAAPGPARPVWLRWQRATARASAVSAGAGTESRPSRALTM